MILRFIAIILTGLTMIAPGAHLFELPAKINMPQTEYFVVQSIYSGWWMVGLLLPAALIGNGALAIALRRHRPACLLAIAAAALIALNLVIFTIWTQPANAATANWTTIPDNWEMLRRQWEYSHAVNAGVILLAFCAATLASLRAPLPADQPS